MSDVAPMRADKSKPRPDTTRAADTEILTRRFTRRMWVRRAVVVATLVGLGGGTLVWLRGEEEPVRASDSALVSRAVADLVQRAQQDSGVANASTLTQAALTEPFEVSGRRVQVTDSVSTSMTQVAVFTAGTKTTLAVRVNADQCLIGTVSIDDPVLGLYLARNAGACDPQDPPLPTD